MITIETIDEFRRRTNSSYDDARCYLERHNGELLEAIIDFEKTRNNSYSNNNGCRQNARPRGEFGMAIMRGLQKLLDIRIVVTDKTERTFNVPILFPILVCPLWHVMILLAIVMMIMGFKFSVREIQDDNMNIENIISRLRERAKTN